MPKLLFLAALIGVGGVQSDPVPAAQSAIVAPPDDAIAAARELLIASGFERQMADVAPLSARATLGAILQQVEARHEIDLPTEIENQLHRIAIESLETSLGQNRQRILDEAARLYALRFTISELRELQRLQTAPVMVKFQQVAPQLMAEFIPFMVALSSEDMPEVQRRVLEVITPWIAQQAERSNGPR